MVGAGADVNASLGARVVIGEGATVRARSIEDAVILPGARVEVEGDIRHCVLAGAVVSGVSLESQIRDGALDS